jgi:hypothetical protein
VTKLGRHSVRFTVGHQANGRRGFPDVKASRISQRQQSFGFRESTRWRPVPERCRVMAVSSVSVATEPKNSIGETYARKVLSDWQGNHVADACIAATQLGLILSGCGLGYERVKEILLEEFNSRKVDDVNWSVVNEAFQNGRSAVISPTQLRERFYPAARLTITSQSHRPSLPFSPTWSKNGPVRPLMN